MKIGYRINDFDLVWAKDKFQIKAIHQVLENDLHEYPYSAQTSFFLIYEGGIETSQSDGEPFDCGRHTMDAPPSKRRL